MPWDTPQPHESAASRYYMLVDRGELEQVLELFAPDIVYDRPGHGKIRGTDALRHFFLHERRLASSQHTIRRYITEEEWVVAEGIVDARTMDGEHLSLQFVDVFRINGGLITERRGYVSR